MKPGTRQSNQAVALVSQAMSVPVLLAHGEEVLLFVLALGAGALIAGSVGLVAALRKNEDEISVVGAVCSLIGTVVGGVLWFFHGGELPFFDPISILMVLPLPLATFALYFSFRRKKKRPN